MDASAALFPDWRSIARPTEALSDLVGDPLVVLTAERNELGEAVDFLVLWANDVACGFVGAAPDTLRLRIGDLPSASPSWLQRCMSVLASGRTDRFRQRPAGEDLGGPENGSTLDVRIVKLGDGLAVTWRDLTDVELAKERNRLSARLLDEVEAAVITTDRDVRVTSWNRGAEDLYGWSADEAMGRSAFELVAPLLPREAIEERRASILQGRAEWEFEVQRLDGAVQVLSIRISTLGQGAVEGFLAIAVDVTERHRAERERDNAAEFLHALAGGTAEGMFALDIEGRATFVNAAAAAMLGWAPSELLGAELHALLHPRGDGNECPTNGCPIGDLRLGPRRKTIGRDAFCRRDGTSIPVSYTASPIVHDHGECVVVFRDMSEERSEERKAEEALENLVWVGKIQDALDDGRLVLFAQPVIDTRLGTTHHHELLLRMVSRTGDVIAPDRFIPVAEEYGLIGRIDRWVAERAVAFARDDHAVAFNLSARSVSDPRWAGIMRGLLAGHRLHPDLLTCEITETAIVENSTAAELFIRDLRDLGCGVALDDFGAGFAGFGYLKRLSVSSLKIDRQFVSDVLEDEASRHVVAAVVALAKAFDLSTVAEGVEDARTLDLLRDLGVDYVQGYLFGRPKPAHELTGGRRGT